MLDRIEVVQGANAINGLGATGGTINLITRLPRRAASTSIWTCRPTMPTSKIDGDTLAPRPAIGPTADSTRLDYLFGFSYEDRGFTAAPRAAPSVTDNAGRSDGFAHLRLPGQAGLSAGAMTSGWRSRSTAIASSPTPATRPSRATGRAASPPPRSSGRRRARHRGTTCGPRPPPTATDLAGWDLSAMVFHRSSKPVRCRQLGHVPGRASRPTARCTTSRARPRRRSAAR